MEKRAKDMVALKEQDESFADVVERFLQRDGADPQFKARMFETQNGRQAEFRFGMEQTKMVLRRHKRTSTTTTTTAAAAAAAATTDQSSEMTLRMWVEVLKIPDARKERLLSLLGRNDGEAQALAVETERKEGGGSDAKSASPLWQTDGVNAGHLFAATLCESLCNSLICGPSQLLTVLNSGIASSVDALLADQELSAAPCERSLGCETSSTKLFLGRPQSRLSESDTELWLQCRLSGLAWEAHARKDLALSMHA